MPAPDPEQTFVQWVVTHQPALRAFVLSLLPGSPEVDDVIQELPEAERPRQLLPLAKTLTDTVKMIAYRAEAAPLHCCSPISPKQSSATRKPATASSISSADPPPKNQKMSQTFFRPDQDVWIWKVRSAVAV